MANDSRLLLLGLGFGILGVALAYREQVVAAAQQAGDIVTSVGEQIMFTSDNIPTQYRDAVAAAEQKYGLPANLLGRLLYQESHYRPDIINGTTRSPAGALGIAQFMPATAAQFGIDPLDPFQSIDAAGRYLAQLYATTGSWLEALAAYNWGIGNVQRKGVAAAPAETQQYFTQILTSLGMDAVA